MEKKNHISGWEDYKINVEKDSNLSFGGLQKIWKNSYLRLGGLQNKVDKN
jgi:hypothetical protein